MNTLQFIHSGWAYLTLLVLVIATLNASVKFFKDKAYDAKDFRISLFALITMHIQLVLGIILFFTKGYFEDTSMGDIMKSAVLRSNAIEHPLTMIIAVALLTIGYSKHKKKLISKSKFKMLAIFYTLALLLVLTKIPWSTWIN